LDYPNYTVVVCDNASSDGSLEHICRWASGEKDDFRIDGTLAYLTTPRVAKPVPFVLYSSPVASVSGAAFDGPLVLIQTGSNLGFAGGCNVGLRYALARTGCEFAWLLNNDTVVARDSLTRLVEEMRADPGMGICGSVLLDYASPQTVRVYGGRRYSTWRGRVLPERKSRPAQARVPARTMDYVHGASMLVRREFLDSVGLMEEGYFLYFEELDWAMRAAGRFRLGYAPLSFVYHKEGASIGTSSNRRNRSLLAERYATRNRLLFTRKFCPALVPSVLGWVILAAIHRLLAGDVRKALQIVAAAWEGLSCPKLPLVNRQDRG
jgi:GT2 family glycosyltransferase